MSYCIEFFPELVEHVRRLMHDETPLVRGYAASGYCALAQSHTDVDADFQIETLLLETSHECWGDLAFALGKTSQTAVSDQTVDVLINHIEDCQTAAAAALGALAGLAPITTVHQAHKIVEAGFLSCTHADPHAVGEAVYLLRKFSKHVEIPKLYQTLVQLINREEPAILENVGDAFRSAIPKVEKAEARKLVGLLRHTHPRVSHSAGAAVRRLQLNGMVI